MNVVNINGRTYSAPDGVSVSVINNKVYFNGKLQEDLTNWKEKNIEIIVCGNCKEVKADAGNITVEGNVEGDASSDAGNIKIRGDVKGNAHTDCGNISAHHIFGNANTDCGNIKGAQNVNSVNIGNGSWFNNIIEKIFD
jgi:hypothetical protein